MTSVVIVNYNGEKYLRRTLGSLARQSYHDLEVILVDNASTDGSVALAESVYPQLDLIRNKENLGFCSANNQGIECSRSKFVMFLNQDVELEPDYIQICVGFLEQNRKVGAVQGKFLRINWETGEKSGVIDSAGIEIFKNGREVSRGENQIDQGRFDRTEEVFGVDGAGVVFHRQALESIKVLGEYEDEDFFMYKDDIDYSWRLRLMGWQIWYLPAAVAYHGRTSSGTGRQGSYLRNLSAFVQNERQKKDYVTGLSFKNQWLTLIKNLTGQQFVRYAPFLFFREAQLLAYNLFFRPRVFVKYGWLFLTQLPRALQKRRIIQSRKQIAGVEIGRWFR